MRPRSHALGPAWMAAARAGLAVVLAACVAVVSAPAAPMAAVRPQVIEAGLFYQGATLTIEGSVKAGSEVALRIVGPSETRTFNRRGKLAGWIWGGLEHVTFRQAPSLYAVASSAPLTSLANQEVLLQLRLGREALERSIQVDGTRTEGRRVVADLLTLKESEGLYRVEPETVALVDTQDGRRRFRLEAPIPAAAPAGELEVTVYEFSNGAAVALQVAHVSLVHVGLPRFLAELSRDHGALFGLLAALMTLLIGLAASFLGSLRRASSLRDPGPKALGRVPDRAPLGSWKSRRAAGSTR